MSHSDQSQNPPRDVSPQPHQDPGLHPSRRQVIAGAGAGLGLVATGALAGVAGSTVLASGRTGSSRSGSAGDAAQASGDVVVAHVRDASTGDIDVYVGERQVRIRDRAVAARLSSVTG